MNRHRHHPHAPRDLWNFRIRLVTLIVLLTLGLGTAAVERWRQDEFERVYLRVHDRLSYFLNPISERAGRLIMVASRIEDLMKVESDNKRLLHDLSEQQISNQLLYEKLSRLSRLAGLGQWSGPEDVAFITADVSELSINGQNVTLKIKRGRDDGVRPRDPVVALGGLVGIVQSVNEFSATVQAITDGGSNVGVMDQASRARGVIMGRGHKESMWFMPENEVQPINKNAVLITSGFDNSVYPKGVIVGTIQGPKLNVYGMTYGEVKPAVSFESLEEVLLVIPRNRLTGKAGLTTSTLGSRRIFMPAQPKAARIASITTGTLPANGSSTATLSANNPTSGTASATPTPPAQIDAPSTATQDNTPDEPVQLGNAAEVPEPTPTPTPKPTPTRRRSTSGDMAPEDFSR